MRSGAGCDLVAFMWNDGGSAVFFSNAGYVSRWRGALHVEPDERRGILYVPRGAGAEVRDSVARYTMFATVASADAQSFGGLHGTLQTTDAFTPGESPSDQPVRSGDGVLHARAGDTVVVTTPDGTRATTVVRAATLPPAPNVSVGWLRTSASSYALRVTSSRIDVDVPVTFTNRSEQTLWHDHQCTPYTSEQWTTIGWRYAYVEACTGVVPPDSIPAGATVTDTVRIRSWRLPRSYPRFDVDPIPGTYRVVYFVFGTMRHENIDYVLSDLLPTEQRVSNTFTLTLP